MMKNVFECSLKEEEFNLSHKLIMSFYAKGIFFIGQLCIIPRSRLIGELGIQKEDVNVVHQLLNALGLDFGMKEFIEIKNQESKKRLN